MSEPLESSSGTPLQIDHRLTDNTAQAIGPKLALRRWARNQLTDSMVAVVDVFPGERVMRRGWPKATFTEGIPVAPISFDAIDADPYGDPWAALCAVAACRRSDGPLAVVWTDGTGIDQRLTGGLSEALQRLTGIEPARGLARRGVWERIQRSALDGFAGELDMTVDVMRWSAYRNLFYAAALLH